MKLKHFDAYIHRSDMCRWWLWWAWWLLAAAVAIRGVDVTYDGRSLIIDGQRKLLFSGSIHYPRSTPDMWPSLIRKAKEGGLDVIQTYTFWNLHEPQPGQYDFSGRKDIVRFVKEIQAQGLYACLRIGPYIEAEWTYGYRNCQLQVQNVSTTDTESEGYFWTRVYIVDPGAWYNLPTWYGGFPFWLHDVPGIVFRSDNEPFKLYMQNYTAKIVNMMKLEGLYASQGGPIILSQIENEYQNIEQAFGEKGPSYVRWAAEMAVGLETGVPWDMCKQDDAPDPVINACNGMKCGDINFAPNSPNKPAIWTENWTSFIQVYGSNATLRSAEDIAFHVALFIARKNGSYINYYMYHGGTNFGRTAASFMITGYYDQAPLDEYGLLREPKWGHLKELHAAIKMCSQILLSGTPNNFSLAQFQQAYVFRGDSGACAAFLINRDGKQSAVVQFQNSSYELPPKSISILPDCKTVVFNTAKVNTQSNTRSMQPALKFDSAEQWEEFKEQVVEFDDTTIRADTLLEHMNTTKDVSDYLWYTMSLQQDSSDPKSAISVKSLGHVLHIFVNGELVGSAHGAFRNSSFTLESTVSLNEGVNNISLLSATVGLPDSGAFLERSTLGPHKVTIEGSEGSQDLSNNSWGYQVGLLGEKLQIYSTKGSNVVQWKEFSSSQPLVWYKTVFDEPEGNDPLALNLGSMGKGEVWVNGQSIGRYWVSFRTLAGTPSQTWYNVPRSFLKPTGNLLILFEEYGNPCGITLDTVSITSVCGHVTDSNLPFQIPWKRHARRPKVQLNCPPNRNISKILFASFGRPFGDCSAYAVGSCHSSNSRAIVEKACIGKRKCSISQSYKRFGGDPCPGIPKSLLVDVQCG